MRIASISSRLALPGNDDTHSVTVWPRAARRANTSWTWVSAPPARGWRGSRSFRIRMRTRSAAGDAQSQRDPERLEADPPAELRGAAAPVDEEERDLLEARARARAAVIQLDLEPVAVRAHVLDADPFEQLAAQAAEPARGVGDREAGHEPHVGVAEIADQDPLDRPVHHGDAVDVAGSAHHVVTIDLGQHRREHRGRVGEVC